MKRKFFAAFLSLYMVMSLVPMTALAAPENDGAGTPSTQAATELPGAVDGVITLTGPVDLKNAWKPEENVTLNLNGNTLTLPRLDAGNGVTITITDSQNGDGKIVATETISAVVWSGGTLVLEDGTITSTSENLSKSSNTAIFNMGTFTIRGGKVEGGKNAGTGVYNTVRNKDTYIETPVICNIEGGEIEASYGVCAFGPGVPDGDLSKVNNDQVTINITGGEIRTNGQGIATNASSGRYAGFTINMRGGSIVDLDNASTGMYLPAIGVTNITGGTITASQAIRIGAGELNITGGTITCTVASDNQDLVPGASGGTKGAIVVGKASNGYVGDISVNVSDDAVIRNIAERTGDTNAVYPTVVVSDKNMANTGEQQFVNPTTGEKISQTFQYSDTTSTVVINAEITGDVVKISAIDRESGTSQDGGNTSLDITGGTVTGNVINQTKEGDVGISGSSITGNVTNASKGEVVISNNSKIDGTVSNTGVDGEKGSVAILDSAVGTVTDNQDIVLVNTTVGGNTEPTTNTEGKVAMIGAKTYETLEKAIEEAQDGDTITLLKSFTVNTEQNSAGSGAYNISGKTLTIDGNNYTITAGTGFDTNDAGTRGEYHIFNITDGANVTIRDLTIDGKSTTEENSVPRSGINVYANDGATSPTATLINVEIKNCSTYGVTVADAAVEATDLKTSGNSWGGVNVDPRNNEGKASFMLNGENSRLEDTSNGIKIDNTYSASNSEAANVIVNDGYVSSITEDSNNNASSTAITVNGGSFGESVAEYVKGDLKYEANANGTYTYYDTLDEALDSGGEVKSIQAAKPGATAYTVKIINGSNTVEYQLASGESVTLEKLTDQGYNHFVGWTDQAGKHYDGGDTVTITADTTFTAQWSYVPPANPNYKITIGAMENGTVTANPTAAKAGATVTLTPVPDEGYALSTLTVTDRFGDAVRVTEQADGTYTFTMPNGQVTVTATFVETEAPVDEPFVDVAEGDWFYDAVVYAYQNELMDGVGGNRFAPNSETTRAQLVTILYRLEGQPAVSGDLPFTDVESGTWYTDAILWAAQNNIVNGVNDTEFAPGDDLTRQQLVTILYRYAEAKGYDVSASADLSGYPDADQVQDYAQPAMAWAVAENIIQGMEDGTLKPAGNASRAQIATILMWFCEDVAQ